MASIDGTPIRSISIPGFWLGSILIGENISPQNVSVHKDGLRFAVQKEQFTYDRFGLRRLAAT
jgi:hypothetical protein